MIDYTPWMLRFDRAGVDWIVDNADELKGGEWPGGIPSDYINPPSRRRLSFRAPFENACLVIAELEIRIKRCGLDGLLAEKKVDGKEEEEIARERYLDVDFVRRRINKVLWYCASGRLPRWVTTRRRKGLTYDEWKGTRGYRKRAS